MARTSGRRRAGTAATVQPDAAAATDAGPIAFAAALAPSPRKTLSMDADGEVTLTLIVPYTDATLLVSRWSELMDRTLLVAIVPQ